MTMLFEICCMITSSYNISLLTITEMPINAYFKPVETIAAAASLADLSIQEVEITKQVHTTSKEVSKRKK